MLKDLFTRNLSLKLTAVALAVVLWLVARYLPVGRQAGWWLF